MSFSALRTRVAGFTATVMAFKIGHKLRSLRSCTWWVVLSIPLSNTAPVAFKLAFSFRMHIIA